MRIGAKQKPFYRVVVVDERSKRTGAYIELLGTYNPLTEPKDIKLKQDRIDHWLKQGAQKSDGFLRIIGEAPQRPPRKPKKSVQGTVDSVQVKAEEPKTEEKPIEEAPKEEILAETSETVIESEAKQSSLEENPDKIATEPSAPRNDETGESEKKNEGPA